MQASVRRFALGSIVSVLVLLGAASAAPAAGPLQLALPQSSAFAVLGYSCGGISEHAYATGFDPTSGYPTGAVYLSTSCSSGGRGSRPSVHTAWAGATWDYTAAVVSYAKLSSAPSVSTSFSAFDQHGNEVYNTSTAAYLLLANGFAFPPRLTGISVTQGPASGGTSVTITGTGFSGITAVQFGSIAAASYTVNSGTSITAVSPKEAGGTVDVTVTSAGGTSATGSADQFTFVAAPTVSGVSPNSGTTYGGTVVTITGTNFTGATSVAFGGTPGGFYVDSSTTITAYSPGSEGETDTVNVTVTNIGGKSPATAADRFTYVAPPPPPAVTSVSPSSGSTAGGDTVTITGTAFANATEVDFGGTPASFTITSDTAITAVTPAGFAGAVDVTVSNANGMSAYTSADQFTYVEPPPTVSAVSPSSGSSAGGDTVAITGSGFSDATAVNFGATPASFTINDDTSITATTPAGTGAVDITVTAGGGTSTTSSADQFTYF